MERTLRQVQYAAVRTCICGEQFNSRGRLITHCIRESGRRYYCEGSKHYPTACDDDNKD